MNLTLPPILSKFIQATNARDHQALVALFASDAVVSDESQTHEGSDQIRAWSERTAQEYGFTLEPLQLSGEETEPELRCQVSGTFDGSPIELRFLFSLEGAYIRRLTIRD